MKIKELPLICLGRYNRHHSVWTDKDGVTRCRRCHKPWTPNTYIAKTSARDRIDRREQARESFMPQKPVVPPINPDCLHPAPETDPMKAHFFAQECMATGVTQRECEVCHQWIWSTLFREETTP